MISPVKALLLSLLLSLSLFGAAATPQPNAVIAIDGMEMTDFVKFVAKTTNKNIFITDPLQGKISYAGNKPIKKSELFEILQSSLEARGLTLIDTGGGYLTIVKLADASTMNLPVMERSEVPQMQTEIFKFRFATADTMAAKLKHFASKNGKLTPSKETNAVIVTDFPANLTTIKKALAKLDVRDETTANYTHVILLKNADAKSLVATLNTIISKMTLSAGQQPPSITSDDNTNALIVVSSDELFTTLLPTIQSLDGDRQQVYVKAKIIEISENRSQEVGLKYGLSGGSAGQNGLFTFNSLLGDGKVGAVNVDATLLSKLSIPSITSGVALGANIALLNSQGAANILSEPSILCINNQESSIYVGKTKSINMGTTLTGTGLTQSSYTRQDIGLTLKIKPRLSNDNKVLLAVETKLEDIESETTVGLPTTTKREVKTSAIVNNGESVIIGGLIKEKNDQGVSKIPLLGDIPVLGHLFKDTSKSRDKINLVIILTPYIVEKSTDLETLKMQLSDLEKIQNDYINKVVESITHPKGSQ